MGRSWFGEVSSLLALGLRPIQPVSGLPPVQADQLAVFGKRHKITHDGLNRSVGSDGATDRCRRCGDGLTSTRSRRRHLELTQGRCVSKVAGSR